MSDIPNDVFKKLSKKEQQLVRQAEKKFKKFKPKNPSPKKRVKDI